MPGCVKGHTEGPPLCRPPAQNRTGGTFPRKPRSLPRRTAGRSGRFGAGGRPPPPPSCSSWGRRLPGKPSRRTGKAGPWTLQWHCRPRAGGRGGQTGDHVRARSWKGTRCIAQRAGHLRPALIHAMQPQLNGASFPLLEVPVWPLACRWGRRRQPLARRAPCHSAPWQQPSCPPSCRCGPALDGG